jgi:hypothetical protein
MQHRLVEPKLTHGIQSLQFPAGSAPLVSKISIFMGQSPTTAIPPEMPSICLNKDVFSSKIRLIRDKSKTKGLHLNLFMNSTQSSSSSSIQYFDAEIYFNDTCQDILTLIGTPSSVYFKFSEELNKLNNGSSSLNYLMNNSGQQTLDVVNNCQKNDYFYNYITLGMDILFSAETNRCTKFVLHSNFPCHFNFNSYFMCNFEIPIQQQTKPGEYFIVTPSTTVRVFLLFYLFILIN